MNAADQNLLNWLKREINTGKTKIIVPAYLLENTTPEGLAEARRLEELCCCELVARV